MGDTVEHAGQTRRGRRYFLVSAKLDPKALAAAVRPHRGIENRLHRVLDVVFHNDLARLRSGHGPHAMAVVKHMAMNLIHQPNDKHSLKNRRKPTCLTSDHLASLIQNQPPST